MLFKFPFYNLQIDFRDLLKFFFIRNPKQKLLSALKNYFSIDNIILTKSGRQGIKIILKSLNLDSNDEVIISSFICGVVPEAVIRAGAKPVFCDVEPNNFNLDIESVKKAINPKTKVIILSYTFGIPAKSDEFLKLCRENNLVLIEDCAQSFGAKYKNRFLGTWDDFSVFSFGISKNIGGLGGGFIHCQQKEDWEEIKQIVSQNKKNFSVKKYFEFFLSPLIFNKYFYWLISSLIEKYAQLNRESPNQFLSSISNLETKVAWLKLKKYKKIIKKRQKNAILYYQRLKSFFSFPLVVSESKLVSPYLPILSSEEMFKSLKKKSLPVKRMEFGGLEKDERFKHFKFFNDNEKIIRKKYFLLPLDISSKEIKSIIQKIQKIKENYASI